eukprot:3553404-Pyramimonas_sp.AAC.1
MKPFLPLTPCRRPCVHRNPTFATEREEKARKRVAADERKRAVANLQWYMTWVLAPVSVSVVVSLVYYFCYT